MTVKTKTLRKHCRALGVNLIGTPSAALTLQRRPNRPGQHGAGRRAKLSPFAMQLMETQKLKHYYGVTAKQLKRYYDRASKSKEQTNVFMVQLLEQRLDNMVYRMGFSPTLRAARQMVVHRHIMVNGKNINKPSMEVRVGDEITRRSWALATRHKSSCRSSLATSVRFARFRFTRCWWTLTTMTSVQSGGRNCISSALERTMQAMLTRGPLVFRGPIVR